MVNPKTTTTYYLNVKDVYGCTVTAATKTIYIVDVRCGSKLDKVTVCNYQRGNYTTTCLSADKVSDNLANGSYLGECKNTLITTSARTTEQQLVQKQTINTNEFEVKVAPNPSSAAFRISIFSTSNEPVTIRLIDVSGRTLEILNATGNKIISLGSNLIGGTYFAEIMQGKNRQTVKLIKL